MTQPDHDRRGPKHPLAIAAIGGVVVAVLTLAVLTARPRQPPPELTVPATPVAPAAIPTASRTVQRAKFFDDSVQPEIATTDQLNRQAADRCLQRIAKLIDGYRQGIDPFVADLTSVSTRLGIARRLPGDWWYEDQRIDQYVQEKFERHLFSEASLTADIVTVLDALKSEIEANQNRLLVNVQASLQQADLPEVQLADYSRFASSVATQLQQYSAAQGTATLYSALATLVASEVGSYAAITVVGGLLARFGTAAAAGAAAGAGATAGATAAGAGGGSMVGPVGTVVGLGIGLAVGLLIDWWMTEKFEDKMNAEMNRYLGDLQQTLLDGSSLSPIAAPGSGGLAAALPVLCDQLRQAYRDRFYQQIVQAESN